jgi:hypothetical protein
MNAEACCNHGPVEPQGPEPLLNRVRATRPLESVQEKPKVHLADGGRPQIFGALLPFPFIGDDPPSHREMDWLYPTLSAG